MSDILPSEIRLRDIGKEVYAEDSEIFVQKRISKGVLFCEMGKQRDEYVISYFTLIIIFVSIGVDIFLLLKYTSTSVLSADVNAFLIQITVTMSFIMFGFVLHFVFVNRSIKNERFTLYTLISIGLGIGIGGASLLFQSILRGIKLSVVPFDYFLFFITVAVSEEMLWRFGIQPSFKILFNFTFYRTKYQADYQVKEENRLPSVLLSSGLSIGASAGLFTLFHIFVYNTSEELLIIFVLGAIFGISMEITRRVDVSIVAHMMVNIIGGIALINQLFGGF